MEIIMSEKPTESTFYQEELEEANEVDDFEEVELSEWDSVGLRPDTPLLQQHREICRHLAHGRRNKWICEKMGVTPAWVSTLKRAPKIQREVARIRDKLFSVDLATRFKELGDDAMDVMESIIMSPHVSLQDKESAAKWILEKTTGKPAQQVEHKGEVSIGVFLDKLDQQKDRASLPAGDGEPFDVTPSPTQQPEPEPREDDFSTWLDKHLD